MLEPPGLDQMSHLPLGQPDARGKLLRGFEALGLGDGHDFTSTAAGSCGLPVTMLTRPLVLISMRATSYPAPRSALSVGLSCFSGLRLPALFNFVGALMALSSSCSPKRR